MQPAFRFLLLAAAAATPACLTPPKAATPVGTWSAEFWLDSAGPLDSTPAARYVTGVLTIGDSGKDSTSVWPDTSARIPAWLGNFDVDFFPFFGSRVARDVSTTFFGPTTGSFVTELTASLDPKHSLHLSLIPRISHGGIDATGLLQGDTVLGLWYVRSYAGGASGHFRLTRTSSSPPPVRRDPPPPPPDTLPLVKRGTIFVRIQDIGTGRYLRMRHGLHTEEGGPFPIQ
jgi:hypothetical protein